MISQEEFYVFFKDYGLGQARLAAIFASIDKDHSGYVFPWRAIPATGEQWTLRFLEIRNGDTQVPGRARALW